ncbi:MAG: MMPL family transporter [Bacteroidales bacterium]|nr:MMPL family transporter [Bacteroidales bacterium]
MLSEKNQVYIDNLEFKETFGEEANAIFVGINDADFFDIEHYKLIKGLCEDLSKHKNVTSVLTVYQAINLRQVTVDDEQGKRREFELYNLFPENIQTQEQLDSLKEEFFNLPFYKGLLYGKHSNVFLLSVGVNHEILDAPERIPTVQGIEASLLQFSEDTGIELNISGHPFIRTKMMVLIKSEIKIFIILAALIAVAILFLFFRSFKVVLISILLVGQGVIWSMGTMALLGFKITILSSMIPPLLIIIGMPNAVYLLNKYHSETKRHSNKFLALHRTIHRTGNAVFLSNLTTAVGFATFMITNSSILNEFGAIASLGIMFTFMLAIIIVPSLVSLWKVPSEKYTKHLENLYVKKILGKIYNITIKHRKKLFIGVGMALIIGLFGISLIKQTGYIMDDVPSSARMYKDLKKLEDNFNGVSPLEIMIRSHDSITGHDFICEIQKLDSLQTELLVYDELSRSMSIADAVKFLNQAYSRGNVDRYCIPDNPRTFETIFNRLPQNFDFTDASIKSFIDSTKTVTRLSLNIRDVGTKRMKVLIPEIDSLVKKYFPQEEYRTLLSGSTLLYFTGTTFLTKNLFISLALAFVIIGLLLFWMFRSFKMMVLALIPNIIPMLITAGIMGIFGIPLKPSTILVYGVAFGISVDGTIHFLNRYRHELHSNNWNIGEAVKTSIFEIGVSMTYTYSILFFGFIIFSISEFGGTKALGMLVSLELLIAMLSNLVVLPALLLSLEKFYGRKVLVAPPIPIIEEDVKCDPNQDTYDDMEDSNNN